MFVSTHASKLVLWKKKKKKKKCNSCDMWACARQNRNGMCAQLSLIRLRCLHEESLCSCLPSKRIAGQMTALRVCGSGLRHNDGSGIKLSDKLAWAWWSVFGRAHRGSTIGLLLLQRFRVGLLLSTRFFSVMDLDSYVRCFDSLIRRGPSGGPNNFYEYMNHHRT